MLDVTTTNGNKNSQEYLYDLLTRIKQRPGMYLGKVSITRLKMLLMGYSMSRGELGLQLTQRFLNPTYLLLAGKGYIIYN